MTAITTKASALSGTKTASQEDAQRRRSITPSASEAEAKTRFVSALNKGVHTLLHRGHGRERASTELLTEISDGCSPDEDEIFQTMGSLGISLEDATKVMTVSAAFRKARTIKGGSEIAAVDELTSRLNLAGISRKGSSRSPSPSPSVSSTHSTPSSNAKLNAVATNESGAPLTRSSAVAKKGQRSARAKSHQQQQGKGRKRGHAEKMPENSKTNALLEEPKDKVAVAADFQVKEKIAKLSKAEGKKPKSSARAKSPDGLGLRGKRMTVSHVDEVHSNKRPRTQTEESIPTV